MKFRLQNNYFFMRITERIVQNTIKIINLRKKLGRYQKIMYLCKVIFKD